MPGRSNAKVAGYALCLGIPLLAPLGVWLGAPWLALVVVFGLLPILGFLVGEDRALPMVGPRRSRTVVAYLDLLPRIYVFAWLASLVWAADYAADADLSVASFIWVTLSVGLGSAVAIPTAHVLMHRRSAFDVRLARLTNALCLYGHMITEHLHHHATIGVVAAGETAPRGISIYRFAPTDFLQGLRNAWAVETARLRRCELPWWRNQVVQDYALAAGLALLFFASFGIAGFVLFVGQAVFAVFVFEVITYVHHYGLVRDEGEEPSPQHAWAHHCWITNCLTFNNTFHGDHHLRPYSPYYELHAMYGAPRLPANYVTMFWIALVPPVWRMLMDRRLDLLAHAKASGELGEQLQAQHCR